jgi:hypothetical protein
MHTHSDHFDTLASEKLQRHQIILPTCRQRIYGKANFVNAEVIKTKATFENITLTRTGGKHSGEILAQMGEVSDSYCKPKTNRLLYCWRQHVWKKEQNNF